MQTIGFVSAQSSELSIMFIGSSVDLVATGFILGGWGKFFFSGVFMAANALFLGREVVYILRKKLGAVGSSSVLVTRFLLRKNKNFFSDFGLCLSPFVV